MFVIGRVVEIERFGNGRVLWFDASLDNGYSESPVVDMDGGVLGIAIGSSNAESGRSAVITFGSVLEAVGGLIGELTITSRHESDSEQ